MNAHGMPLRFAAFIQVVCIDLSSVSTAIG